MFFTVLLFYLLVPITGRPVVPAKKNTGTTEKPFTRANNYTTEKPWYDAKKFQGDIEGYDKDTFDGLVNDLNRWENRRLQRKNPSTAVLESATSDPRGLWMNGRVPYVFDTSDPRLKEAVLDAMKEFHNSTCIQFIKHTKEKNYLSIGDNDDGCYSRLGNAHKGAQIVNLGPGCKIKGIAIHELMHAIGFWHEHQRIDRDNYVVVSLENVEPPDRNQYVKANTSQMNLIGKYDLSSVMHYPADAFAQPGKVAMTAKNSKRVEFGGEQLTDEDKLKIRQLYRCDDGTKGDTSIAPDAVYFIKPERTDNCLDVPGSSTQNGVHLQQWDCNGSPAQQWTFTKLADNVYYMKNVGNGKYIDIAPKEVDQEGGKVQQFGPPTRKHQQFKLEPREGGVFHITSVANGKVIWADVKGKLRHWKFDAGQNWKLERMRSDSNIVVVDVPYLIKEPGTYKCWDVPRSSKVNGVNLQIFDCNQSGAQQWIFKRINDSVYAIRNVGNGKYVDVAPEEVDKEAGKVQQIDGKGKGTPRPGQQFRIVPRNGAFHITSVANGRIIWADFTGALHHWKLDHGQDWKLERMELNSSTIFTPK